MTSKYKIKNKVQNLMICPTFMNLFSKKLLVTAQIAFAPSIITICSLCISFLISCKLTVARKAIAPEQLNMTHKTALLCKGFWTSVLANFQVLNLWSGLAGIWAATV